MPLPKSHPHGDERPAQHSPIQEASVTSTPDILHVYVPVATLAEDQAAEMERHVTELAARVLD